MRFVACLLAIMVLVSSCGEEVTLGGEEQIVVDGWIDAGGFPVVMLTSTVVVTTTKQDFSDLNRFVVKHARVKISCGEDSVVLSGKHDRGYFPPYVYTTSRMRGEAGKTYDLTIECDGKILTASTTIPDVVPIDSLSIVRSKGGGERWYVKTYFSDKRETRDYYKIFSSTDPKSKMYLTSYMQTMADDVLGEHNEVAVYRGTELSNREYEMGFHEGESVLVKLCHIDSVSYAFWHEYENSLSFSRNAVLQFNNNLPTNIDGGIGCWCGYGASRKVIEIMP